MRIRRGAIARFTLTDGSTIEATVRAARRRTVRVDGAVFYDARTGQPVPAAGVLLIAVPAIVFVQLVEAGE